VDALGNPTGFVLTPRQASDLEGADVLLKDIDDTPYGAVPANIIHSRRAKQGGASPHQRHEPSHHIGVDAARPQASHHHGVENRTSNLLC